MGDSKEMSPNVNATETVSKDGDGTDPQLEKIGEVAASFFSSDKFCEIIGKQIEKCTRADKVKSVSAQADDHMAPMKMQLSMGGKTACKSVKSSEMEQRSNEGGKKRAKLGSNMKKLSKKLKKRSVSPL